MPELRAFHRLYRARSLLAIASLALVTGCNAILIPDPNVKYIAFGDSATDGTDENNYVLLLPARLGEPPERIANEGFGGETSIEGLPRLTSLLASGKYPNAEVLLYWEGGNDIRDFIATHDPLLLFSPDDTSFPFPGALDDQLEQIALTLELGVEAGKSAGLEVFLATYFPIREEVRKCEALLLDLILPVQAQRANAYVVRLNERIRTVAAETGAVLVDVAQVDEIGTSRQNYTDCNHMSTSGNAYVADVFADAVTASAAP
ncbi:MAG: SGNH/GDSL hydrolase family protein [Phycisphaerae bacterium]|jgi:lysophospholipase L1-like esterase